MGGSDAWQKGQDKDQRRDRPKNKDHGRVRSWDGSMGDWGGRGDRMSGLSAAQVYALKERMDRTEKKRAKKKQNKLMVNAVTEALGQITTKKRKAAVLSDSDTSADSDGSDSSGSDGSGKNKDKTVTSSLLSLLSGRKAGGRRKKACKKSKNKGSSSSSSSQEADTTTMMKMMLNLIPTPASSFGSAVPPAPAAAPAKASPRKSPRKSPSKASPRRSPAKKATPKKIPKSLLRALGGTLGYDRATVDSDMSPNTAAARLAAKITVPKLRAALDQRSIPNRGEHKAKAVKLFTYELEEYKKG